jgi:superfamily I DNA/RNA helicase
LFGKTKPLNSWDYLYADLQESLQVWRSVQDGANRSGRILVTTATNARGLPHDYVYIVGMSEGIFPALRKEDHSILIASAKLCVNEATASFICPPKPNKVMMLVFSTNS